MKRLVPSHGLPRIGPLTVTLLEASLVASIRRRRVPVQVPGGGAHRTGGDCQHQLVAALDSGGLHCHSMGRILASMKAISPDSSPYLA